MCDVGELKKSLQNMSCRPITVFLCIILQTSQVGFYARESSRNWCALISENTSHWVYVFAKSTSPSPTMTQCNYIVIMWFMFCILSVKWADTISLFVLSFCCIKEQRWCVVKLAVVVVWCQSQGMIWVLEKMSL